MSKPAYSNLMKALNEGKFVVTGELEPLKTTDLSSIINAAKTIKEYVIAVNVTDNPTAFAYTSPLVACYLVQKETGLECVYQMTVRDRNRLAIISDLLAASILGIKNVLALSGDFVNVGDNPQTKPVYDIDSTQLIYLLRKMVDEGVDLAGNKIVNPPKFNIGGAANPNAIPLEVEVYKLLRKQNAGVDFLQTQSVYDIERLKRFFELCDSIGIKVPILVGVTPIKG
ncbi:MAG: methylenetetrahydrofolate reductase, partial [Candidatus Bathyarchaeia archaeon]